MYMHVWREGHAEAVIVLKFTKATAVIVLKFTKLQATIIPPEGRQQVCICVCNTPSQMNE